MEKAVWPFLLAVMLCASGSFVTAQEDIVGKWKGEIDFTDGRQDATVKFSRNIEGELEGSIDIPGLNISCASLSNIELHDNTVTFSVPDMSGNPSFDGAVSDDGMTITGNVTLNGVMNSFTLKHFDDDCGEE
ncbi:MAG: hypothetical protein J7M24_02440 [Candidatus Latescibacteria bacterium]|nr:hypothetical protein [Candidatus Latescibacterota bacterium]